MILKAQESRKAKEIQEAQESYNTKMIKQSEVNLRKNLYKVHDMVSIKIDWTRNLLSTQIYFWEKCLKIIL